MTYAAPARLAIAFMGLLAVLALTIQPANANYPHLPEFGVDCSACHMTAHSGGAMWPVDADCLECHDGSLEPDIPMALGHSSDTTSDQYGTWSIDCLTCHDGMYQWQFRDYGAEAFIFAGTSDAGGITEFTLTMSGANWTPNEFAGYQLIPNLIVDDTYSYQIISNTANTITVDESIYLPSVTTGDTSFAIIYGRLITTTIDTPNSGPKPVKFFDNSGPNSFADGNAVYDGVCEVCHTQTNHHRNDGTAPGDASGHSDGENCTQCHQHNSGFKASCDSCHSYPPTSGSHSQHLDEDTVFYFGIDCTSCHFEAPHESGTAEIIPGDLFWSVTNGTMVYSNGLCTDACHYGAVWGGLPLTCYDCHGNMGMGGPEPAPQQAPTIDPLPDFASLADPLVSFEWQAVQASYGFPSFAEYLVEVSNDASFGNLYTNYSSGWITDTNWSITLGTAETWYWRITARDATRPEIESETQNGMVAISSPGAPSIPVLDPEPDINAGRPESITVTWSDAIDPEGDSVEYLVEVANNIFFDQPAHVSGSISGTEYTFQTAGCEGLYWRVRSRDASSGALSPWSEADYFEDLFNCGGSCPFLYVWNGSTFELETDLNGPGMLAMPSAFGIWKPNPSEYYVLQSEPVETNGHIEMRLVEERYEVNYLDQFHAYAVDIPTNRDLYSEKPSFITPFKGLEQHLHTASKNPDAPVSVVHVNTGLDVSDVTADTDQDFLILNDDRNTGFHYQTIELDLGDLSGAPQIKLIVDATSAFPTRPEGSARILNFGPRTKLEVLDESGDWVSVPIPVAELPMPPEFRRPFIVDITNIFVSDAYKVRMTFLFKTYVDSIRIDTTADETVTFTELHLASARLGSYGYSDQIPLIDDLFEFEYNLDDPNHEHDYYPGDYTRYGNVKRLLTEVDDKFVIYGSGDELALRFNSPSPPSAGVTRSYAIYSNGYYKVARNHVSATVEPLPFAAMSNFPYDEAVEHYPDSQEHMIYRNTYNTRTMPND